MEGVDVETGDEKSAAKHCISSGDGVSDDSSVSVSSAVVVFATAGSSTVLKSSIMFCTN